MTIYERIRALREQRGLSQQELADRLGYTSRSSITKIEKGLVDLQQTKILAFAEALGVTPAYLMGWETDRPAVVNMHTSIRIPVLGSIPAGIPLEAVEDILDWEEIPADWLAGGKEYFALRVKGDSMSPRYEDGDTLILGFHEVCPQEGRQTDGCRNNQHNYQKHCLLELQGFSQNLFVYPYDLFKDAVRDDVLFLNRLIGGKA